MNHKEIVAAIAEKISREPSEVETLLDSLASIIKDKCEVLTTVAIPGFGKFEAEKQSEYIDVDKDGNRNLYPPKIEVTFKPSRLLNARISENGGQNG